MNRIVSSVPGRLRLRDPALRRPRLLEQLAAALAAVDGVLSTAANAKAGSIVLIYDAAEISQREIGATAEALAAAVLAPKPPAEPHRGAEPPSRPSPGVAPSLRVRVNRQAKRGMLGSLLVSLALAAGGLKRWHAWSGGAFLVFLTIHLAVHRRHLLR